MKVKHDAWLCWICTRNGGNACIRHVSIRMWFCRFFESSYFGRPSSSAMCARHKLWCWNDKLNDSVSCHTQHVSRIFIRMKWKAMLKFCVALSPLTDDHSSHHFIQFDGINMCRSAATACGQPIANSKIDALRHFHGHTFCRAKTTNVTSLTSTRCAHDICKTLNVIYFIFSRFCVLLKTDCAHGSLAVFMHIRR